MSDSKTARKTFTKNLKLKVSEFLESKKNSNNLVDIMSHLEEGGSNIVPCILALERLFSEVLKRKELFVENKDDLPTDTDDVVLKYKMWLRDCYDAFHKSLLKMIDSDKYAHQEQALCSLMKLLAIEGNHPQEPIGDYHYFPKHRLHPLLDLFLSSEVCRNRLLDRFQEYTAFDDVIYCIWKYIFMIANRKTSTNEIFIKNFLALLTQVIIPVPEKRNKQDSEVLCKIEDDKSCEFVLNEKHLHSWLNKIWNKVIVWDHTPATHKQVLVLLLEKVLPHLDKPILLTGFLMSAINVDGPVSLLALQAFVTLIQKYNLEYPKIYGKLYNLLQPSIFNTKYKARFFYLCDMFLSSTHLPLYIVAAYVKRFARLALVAPPQDILIIFMFIGNLMIRHPELKSMMNHSVGGNVNTDPYKMEEPDPEKSNAIQSSLWEVKSLQSHVLARVAQAARFINKPLPEIESEITEHLEDTLDEMFEREMRNTSEEISLTFERPVCLAVPQMDRTSLFWKMG